MSLLKQKLAVIGTGKMGTILLQSMLGQKLITPEQVKATDKAVDQGAHGQHLLPIPIGADNSEAAEWADIILLCVKPQTVKTVVEEIKSRLTPKKLLISIAASIPTGMIEKAAEVQIPVVRTMPNTPCAVGLGMTGICKGRYAQEEHLAITCSIFNTFGRSVVVEENLMDAITGLSGSGPAFVYIILESLAEAGVKVGLPRDIATELAAQTVLGSAQMVLETGHHPALLKDAVTTPAGCTIDGILELEEGKLRVTLIKAVVKAAERARQLVHSH